MSAAQMMYDSPAQPLESSRRAAFLQSFGSQSMCKSCDKRVYEMEKITANGNIYHKSCFRCTHCNRVLSLGNYAAIEGIIYCKPHFLAMFKTKGNYADGFGLENRAKTFGTTDGDGSVNSGSNSRGSTEFLAANESSRETSDVQVTRETTVEQRKAAEELEETKKMEQRERRLSESQQSRTVTKMHWLNEDKDDSAEEHSDRDDEEREIATTSPSKPFRRLDSEEERRSVIRNTDKTMEQLSTTHGYSTKNILAKFQKLEKTPEREPPLQKRQFKWEVKPVAPVNWAGLSVRSTDATDGSNNHTSEVAAPANDVPRNNVKPRADSDDEQHSERSGSPDALPEKQTTDEQERSSDHSDASDVESNE